MAIPSTGTLEYWIDVPYYGDAQKIADIKGDWKDQRWIMIISGAVGFIVGLIGNKIIDIMIRK